MGGYIFFFFFFLNMEFMRRCILSFLPFLVWGGSPTWDNREEALRGAIVYNLLQRVVVLFFLLLFIACTTTLLSQTGIIYTEIQNRDLHCCTASLLPQPSPVYYPPFLKTYQHLGLNLCYNLRTLPLARLLISELRVAPKMLHITTLGALDPQFLDLSKPIYLVD